MDLPILDISYRWNHTTCGLLWLASFTQRGVFSLAAAEWAAIQFPLNLQRVGEFTGEKKKKKENSDGVFGDSETATLKRHKVSFKAFLSGTMASQV